MLSQLYQKLLLLRFDTLMKQLDHDMTAMHQSFDALDSGRSSSTYWGGAENAVYLNLELQAALESIVSIVNKMRTSVPTRVMERLREMHAEMTGLIKRGMYLSERNYAHAGIASRQVAEVRSQFAHIKNSEIRNQIMQ